MHPVMNACTKKNDGILKITGGPSSTQFWKKERRSSSSATYDASGFRLGYDTFAQRSGSLLSSIDFWRASRSWDMKLSGRLPT